MLGVERGLEIDAEEKFPKITQLCECLQDFVLGILHELVTLISLLLQRNLLHGIHSKQLLSLHTLLL